MDYLQFLSWSLHGALKEKKNGSTLAAGRSGCAQPVTLSDTGMRKQWLPIGAGSSDRNLLLIVYHGLVRGSIKLLFKYILFSVRSLVIGIKFL